jgi:hypothetical protein
LERVKTLYIEDNYPIAEDKNPFGEGKIIKKHDLSVENEKNINSNR